MQTDAATTTKNNDDASTHDNDDGNKNRCRKKGDNHLWSECPDNPNSKNYMCGDNHQRGDARSRDRYRDYGGWRERHRHSNNDDGSRNHDRIRGNYGDRHPAQIRGVLIAPLGHPLSVLIKLGIPSAGVVPGDLEAPALVPDNPEVPADAPLSTQDPTTVLVSEVPAWTLMKFQP